MKWKTRTLWLLGLVLVVSVLGAGLLYFRKPSGRATPGNVHRPRRIETSGVLYNPLLEGRWLAWTAAQVVHEPPRQVMWEFTVYDLIRDRALELANNQGRALWLDDDTLYIARAKGDGTTIDSLPADDLFVVDLESGKEALLKEGLSRRSLVSHRYIAWPVPQPEVCGEAISCRDRVEYGCSVGIGLVDQATGKSRVLGTLARAPILAAISDSLLVLSEGMGPCGIKWRSGPIRAIDLDTLESHLVSPATVSPGPGVAVTGVAGRTVVYKIGLDHTRVLRAESQEPVRILLDVPNTMGFGLAGPDVLLYAREDPESPGRSSGLLAINLQTGDRQVFATEDRIKDATGDAQHVAWIDQSERLYVAPLCLEPTSSTTILDYPIPTLSPCPFCWPPVPTLVSPIATPVPAN